MLASAIYTIVARLSTFEIIITTTSIRNIITQAIVIIRKRK